MVALNHAERVEVVTLIDNYTDVLLPSHEHVKRYPHYRNGKIAPYLVAEHGLAGLLRLFGTTKGLSFTSRPKA